MEVFPIIYTRTYYMDFNPNFYICPSILGKDIEVEDVKKYVTEAIRYPNMLDYERRMIVSKNGFTIAGIVCDLYDFVSEIDKENKKILEYTKDSKERKLVSFLGIIFRNKDMEKGTVIEDFDLQLFKLFQEYICNDEMWFNKEENHYISETKDFKIKKHNVNEFEESVKCDSRTIYHSEKEKDFTLFENLLARCISESTKIRFCSNYYGIESIGSSVFYTFSSKYFEKIQKHFEKEKNEEVTQQKKSVKNFFFEKKENNVIIILCIIVIMVVILIFIFNKIRGD